ncbi:MAG: hypothetical protein IBX58_14290 [Roseovarius sp.]|nr:hypothetical protein [Roseovarius sp.]
MQTGGKIFRGDVRLNVNLPNGDETGFLPAQNASAFQIVVPEPEVTERISKMRDTAGQVLDAVSEVQPHQLNITFDGFNGTLLATAFNGALNTYSTDAVTGGAAQILARVGAGVSVGHYNISNVVVKDDNAGEPGTTTFTLGEDYTIEARLGLVVALADGLITEGELLHITFNAAAADGDVIRGAAVSEITASIIFDGIDKVSGQSMIGEFDRVVLSGSGNFDFLADEFNAVEIVGRVITLEGATEPYRLRFPNAAA